MGKICLQKKCISFRLLVWFLITNTHMTWEKPVSYEPFVFFGPNYMYFLLKNKTSNLNDLQYFCVGIFYPYTHFKSGCKLFAHLNFYK